MDQHRNSSLPVVIALGVGFALWPRAADAQVVPALAGLLPSFPGNIVSLRELQNSPDWRVRERAAQRLGFTGDARVIQPLASAAAYDPDPRVRRAANRAIAQLNLTTGGAVSPAPGPGPWPPGPGLYPRPSFVPGLPDPQATLVQTWYERYLKRSPDAAGLQTHTALLQQGISPEEVQAGILASAEYLARYGNNQVEFVRGLYLDVLQRNPDPNEVGTWYNRLGALSFNRQQLSLEFVRGAQPELQQRGMISY